MVLMSDSVATKAPKRDGKPATGFQAEASVYGGHLSHSSPSGGGDNLPLDYKKYRRMRRDPTIALGRDVAVAPILIGNWGIDIKDDDAPPEWQLYMERYILPLRDTYVESVLYGEVDFGWRAYELVFKTVDDPDLGTVVIPVLIKPLKNENTWRRFDEEGIEDGLIHLDPNNARYWHIDTEHSLYVNFDTEGLGNYGDPLMCRCEVPYDEWKTANNAAKRYDEKASGIVWLIWYPPGKTLFENVLQDNSVVADKLYAGLKAGGYIKLPSQHSIDGNTTFEQLGEQGWKFEMLQPESKGADFNSRLNYLDKLKLRGLGVLERAVLEGTYGTKAEAESHTNVMLILMGQKHKFITNEFDKQVVQYLMYLNYGIQDRAHIVAQPLSDTSKEFLQTLLMALLENDVTGIEVAASIDTDALIKLLNIPEADAEEEENTKARVQQLVKQLSLLGATRPDTQDINDKQDTIDVEETNETEELVEN